MHYFVESPKVPLAEAIHRTIKLSRLSQFRKFPYFFGEGDYISFPEWQPLSALVNAEYVTDNDDGLVIDTSVLPITTACVGHVGSLESLKLTDECPFQEGSYPVYGQNLQNYFNWSTLSSLITITGDFRISFWWVRTPGLNSNDIQCFVGHINQNHYIDVTGAGELNDRIRFRINGLTVVNCDNALAGIPNGQAVFIEWIRIGTTVEIKVNNVSKGTYPNQTGSLILTGGANRGGNQPLCGMWGHLLIEDLTVGTYWEYRNRNESGSDLNDFGPNANHGHHYDETFGLKNVDADRVFVPSVERNFSFSTKSGSFSGDSTGSVVFNNMTDKNWEG